MALRNHMPARSPIRQRKPRLGSDKHGTVRQRNFVHVRYVVAQFVGRQELGSAAPAGILVVNRDAHRIPLSAASLGARAPATMPCTLECPHQG